MHRQRRQRLRAEDALVPVRRDSAERLVRRPPAAADANGWYNHAVGVAFQGTDSVLGHRLLHVRQLLAGRTPARHRVAGTCRDKAGNTAPGDVLAKYDATPPTVAAATPDRQPDANGWYNHGLTVTFTRHRRGLRASHACDAAASMTSPTTERRR